MQKSMLKTQKFQLLKLTMRIIKKNVCFSHETYYFLFSLSGFTDAVKEASDSEKNLFLLDLRKIIDVKI